VYSIIDFSQPADPLFAWESPLIPGFRSLVASACRLSHIN
jgi:hypothetical protein